MEIMVGQLSELDEETAAFARQLGIRAVQLNTPKLDGSQGYWTYESVAALKAHCAGYGLTLIALENVPQPFMESIKLGGPDRERQLELYRQTITNVGKAGVAVLGFHFMPTGVWRTEDAVGRGGAKVTAFDLTAIDQGNTTSGPQGETGPRFRLPRRSCGKTSLPSYPRCCRPRRPVGSGWPFTPTTHPLKHLARRPGSSTRSTIWPTPMRLRVARQPSASTFAWGRCRKWREVRPPSTTQSSGLGPLGPSATSTSARSRGPFPHSRSASWGRAIILP